MAEPAVAASMIQKLRWPLATKNTDGSWHIVWNITFAAGHPEHQHTLDAIAHRCDDDLFRFCVKLDFVSHRHLRAVVTTLHWSMEDPYYILTYRMFAILDAELGPVSSIEDQPRKWWRPFRSDEPSSPEYWGSQVSKLQTWAAGNTRIARP